MHLTSFITKLVVDYKCIFIFFMTHNSHILTKFLEIGYIGFWSMLNGRAFFLAASRLTPEVS